MKYEHAWDKGIDGHSYGPAYNMSDKVEEKMRDRSSDGWELVSVVRNNKDNQTFDLFWKKPKED